MAHTYSITDGTTTITLDQASGIMVTGLSLEAPDLTQRDIIANGVDGGEVTDIAQRNVTQTLELLFIAESTTLLQALAQSVEILLQAAHRRQRSKAGGRVYLQIQLTGESDTWRSEILTGRLRFQDEALQQFITLKVEAQLIISRRFFWEGPETELQLSTSNSSAASGGKTIYNHDDAGTGHDNWVQIAAAQVGGVLPAPVRLTLQNNSGGSVGYRNLYLAVNAFSDPANFTHIIEGEARVSGYGTATSNSDCSGGQYNAYGFTNTGLILWDLSSSLLQDTQGRWFRLLARFFGWTGTDVYVKPKLRDGNGLVDLWEGDEVFLGDLADTSTRIVDLGAMPLPVGGYQLSWGAMTLGLAVRSTGAATVDVDFIQLTPLDSYRWIVQRGLNVTNGTTITDDNIEGITHLGGSPIYSPKTGPLMLYPGRTQRIIILQDTGTASNIAHTFSVRAYYRPRRLTI